MAEADQVAALKEALCKQTLLAKELYVELEEERKAAASGVEEALSMIMRLQEEKALANMEACHCRRMADETMQHAEESMLSLREVIFQKELEIQTLKHQVHCYTQKLSSVGINIEFEQIKMDCYPSLRRGSFARILDRNVSLPAVQFGSSETDTLNRFGSSSPIIQSRRKFSEQLNNYVATKRQRLLKPPRSQVAGSNERVTQFMLSSEYTEHISFLNGVLDRASSTDELKLIGDLGHLWYLKLGDISLDLSQARDAWKISKYGSFNHCVLRTRSDGDSLCLIDSQDIYEVQHSQIGLVPDETPKNLSETRYSSGETLEYLKCQNQSIESHTSSYYGEKPTRQQEEVSEICPLIAPEPKNEVCPHQTGNEHIKEKIRWIEEYIKNKSREDLERDADEFKVLKSTIKQFDTMTKHAKKPKIDRHRENDTMLSYLTEAMLYFYI